jgi:hypothetical protein
MLLDDLSWPYLALTFSMARNSFARIPRNIFLPMDPENRPCVIEVTVYIKGRNSMDPVVSRNSNESIGECASRLLDDARLLISRYTAPQCPHRFSLFSCCS